MNNHTPDNTNSEISSLDTSDCPPNETRQQCLDKCQAAYNTCMTTAVSGETPAQRYARCQAALVACQNGCPTACEGN